MRLGPYRVIRQISEGSFGRTFYAEHATLGVPVCVKQEKTGDPEFMRLFREEARLLWDIRHSSLPTLKDYMELPDAGQIMVMSFIAGEELQSVIERRGHVADEHMCWILQRLLDLPDAVVMEVIAIVMGETLASGSAAVEAVGMEIGVDMARCWQADDAFFSLVRDREVLTRIVAEVAGETIASANAGEKAKTLKKIVRDPLFFNGNFFRAFQESRKIA